MAIRKLGQSIAIGSIAIALAIAAPDPAVARVEPGFWSTDAGFDATDIVVVGAATRPAQRATVLEVWRGSVSIGATLVLPELASLGRPSLRAAVFNHQLANLPKRVSGERVVLFLHKNGAGTWVGASSYGELKTSIAWIENGRAFTFEQEINPGPVVLLSLLTEAELRPAVRGLDEARARLAAAQAEPDPATRVRELVGFYDTADADFVRFSPSGIALVGIRHRALPPIERAGDAALPALSDLLTRAS